MSLDKLSIILFKTNQTFESSKNSLIMDSSSDEEMMYDVEDSFDEDSENVKPTTTKKNPGKTTKTVEEIYQKKTQLEHILARPDTYST